MDITIRALSPAINDPTTAVQALDHIEDPLRRLGRRELKSGYAGNETGALRVLSPTTTREDYLTLAFDEIRQYGATSVHVMRRLAVQRYLEHLNLLVECHITDVHDHLMAMQEDRQGLGLPRTRKGPVAKGSQ